MKTKLLSLALTLVIVCSMLCIGSVTAFGAGTVWNGSVATSFAGGTGTKDDPYKIATAEQLKLFADIVNGENQTQDVTACAVLTDDIVLNEGDIVNYDGTSANSWNQWTPIGSVYDASDFMYSGIFNGNGHSISGLYINAPSEDEKGLFGEIEQDAVIKNVSVINSYIKAARLVGSVVAKNQGQVENCRSTGTVNGTANVGGIAGFSYSDATIRSCCNTGSVSASDSQAYIGGIVGSNYGTVQYCYNTGAVSRVKSDSSIGGVTGFNAGTVISCYNTGTVRSSRYFGGVCGRHYGNNAATVNCYYLTGTASGGVNGADTAGSAQAKTAEQFASGEVAWLLNGEKYLGDTHWYMNDGMPTLDTTGFVPRLENGVYAYVKNYGSALTYTVDPTYTVTIPETVTLGETETIRAEGVVVDEGKQVNVALTATSAAENAFTVATDKGATLAYTVANAQGEAVNVGDIVLSVKPGETPDGQTTLSFSRPSEEAVTYSGTYSGTVTFTVSVVNQPISFLLAPDSTKNETIELAAVYDMTWREWLASDFNTQEFRLQFQYDREYIVDKEGYNCVLLGAEWSSEFEEWSYSYEQGYYPGPDDVIADAAVFILVGFGAS